VNVFSVEPREEVEGARPWLSIVKPCWMGWRFIALDEHHGLAVWDWRLQ